MLHLQSELVDYFKHHPELDPSNSDNYRDDSDEGDDGSVSSAKRLKRESDV